MMNKLDLKKELKSLYQVSAKEVVTINVPTMHFIMIDGIGDPNSQQYEQAVAALFAVAYAVKFRIKKSEKNIDFAVMPLEGLWWADDMQAFTSNDRNQWRWTMMIMQPSFVSKEDIKRAIAEVREKKHLPLIDQIRFEEFREGQCAQILHIGPFSEEGPTIERVHDYIDERAKRTGKHHEIYLSDVRRVDAKKWKTIIRQPMQ